MLKDLSKGFSKTTSGLLYKFEKENNSQKPSNGNKVKVHYKGALGPCQDTLGPLEPSATRATHLS